MRKFFTVFLALNRYSGNYLIAILIMGIIYTVSVLSRKPPDPTMAGLTPREAYAKKHGWVRDEPIWVKYSPDNIDKDSWPLTWTIGTLICDQDDSRWVKDFHEVSIPLNDRARKISPENENSGFTTLKKLTKTYPNGENMPLRPVLDMLDSACGPDAYSPR